LDRLGRFLASDALNLRESEPKPTQRSEFDRVVAQLDGTPYGTIAKGDGSRFQLDQDEASLAVVQAALARLGFLPPPLAGLRGLLGVGGEIDRAALTRREKNAEVRERIASVEGFKALFREMLRKALGDRRLCVCIDDLDRCMPDVALDLLEAVKIMLMI